MSKVMWRKASLSTENGGDCVELASAIDQITVRDSKDPSGPKVTMSRNDFRQFVENLKNL
ncbi:DUF397 domain-containing protein [Actinomadura formosensis]|uniref:DUF397 domain-containing protein n=1 Tax=Actinomadura formosensis TaxID=60706 RepID=UPI003D8C5FB5